VTDAVKAALHDAVRAARAALVGKLDGLGEYDVRRPMTPTGTNLLGLVKHLAGVEAGYFGDTFGRPLPDPPAWFADEVIDDDPLVDMWATPQESRAEIVGLFERVARHADATIDALPLDATGTVPHWPADRATVTLGRILVHTLTDLTRHAGHADILRETIDGTAGLRAPGDNLPEGEDWPAHVAKLEAAARAAG